MNHFINKAFLYQVGERIRSARIQRKQTIKQVSASLNLSQQAYGKIERGESNISLARLAQISLVLNVSPAELIPGIYPESDGPTPQSTAQRA